MATSPPMSPTHSFRENSYYNSHNHSDNQQRRRRNSSFSSNHDRSPVTPRSKHRFSNASIGSNDFPTPGEEGERGDGGLGNLADELGDLEDLEDEVYEEGERLGDMMEEEVGEGEGEDEAEAAKEARDSGVDVSYRHHAAADREGVGRGKHIRNFSKPFGSPDGGGGGGGGGARKLPEGYEEDEEPLSRDLEELMVAVAKMANSSSGASSTSTTASTAATEDPLIPRTIAQLQDLGNQTTLEQSAARLNTSTNSMTAHLTSQTKSLQSLASSLYKPFGAAAYFTSSSTSTASSSTLPPLDPAALEDTLPLLDTLLSDLPHPDPAPLQGLQKLSRETDNVIHTLSQLTDTLQMGRQATSAAARHLRTTQMIVAELRRERERADDARLELTSDRAREWEDRLRQKWCKAECEDVVKGFEGYCDSLRGRLEEEAATAAARTTAA